MELIDGRSNKVKIAKIISEIEEANAMQHLIHLYSNRHEPTNLPWLLKEQQSEVVKQVIHKIKFHTGFASNTNNILIREGDFGGAKNQNWHNFIKVW